MDSSKFTSMIFVMMTLVFIIYLQDIHAQSSNPTPINVSEPEDLVTVDIVQTDPHLVISLTSEYRISDVYKNYYKAGDDEFLIRNVSFMHCDRFETIGAQRTIEFEGETYWLHSLTVEFCEEGLTIDGEGITSRPFVLIYGPTPEDIEIGKKLHTRLGFFDEGHPLFVNENDGPPLLEIPAEPKPEENEGSETELEENEGPKPETVIPPLAGAIIAGVLTWRLIKRLRQRQ